MKALRIILTILLITNHQSLITTYAQIAINTDGATPDASAMLDVASSDKGILIPRMDSTSRNSISNPAEGLMVYDSTTASFWYYANASWNNIKQALIADADNDTKIQVEENSDEDIIRFDIGGTEYMRLDNGRIEIMNTGGSVFIGEGVGANDDFSDNRNVFIGKAAGYSNTTGSFNVFTGYQSGYSNTTGNSNFFTGYEAGYSNTTGSFNLFIGFGAGYSNTAGNSNLFTGYLAGFSNTTGVSNLFTGYLAGYSNKTGHLNLFTGSLAGYSNTTGYHNLFIGCSAGYSNNTGNGNVFTGYQAGYSNTTGDKNIFLGYQAGYNETGSNKLYIDNSNTAAPLIYGDFDADSLQINGTLNINGAFTFPTVDGTNQQTLVTDGNGILNWASISTDVLTDADNNTKIQVEESNDEDIIRFDLGGTESLVMEESASGLMLIRFPNNSNNIFLGEDAGQATVPNSGAGASNIFTGYQAGYNNVSGSYNICIGDYAGYSTINCFDNIFIGYRAGHSNTTGDYNVFLGSHAGFSNSTGNNNIFLGYQAGYSETGSNKLYIANSNTTTPLIYGEFNNNLLQINGDLTIETEKSGSNDYVMTIENTSTDNSKRANGINIVAGHDTYNSKNNRLINFSRPDGTMIGEITQTSSSGITYNNTSDIRLKANIQPTEYGLNDILNIQVKDYHYKSDTTKTPQTGFLAQQLHTIYPNAVSVGGEDAKLNPWMVDYSKLTPLLVKGIQDQQEAIQYFKNENNHLKEQVNKQQIEINQLKSQVEKLNALEAKLEQLIQREQ